MQFASDLFVDRVRGAHVQKIPERNGARYLFLLGNIGSPFHWRTEAFVYGCSERFEHVYWLMGPAELASSEKYGRGLRRNVDDVWRAMERLAEDLGNVTALRDSVDQHCNFVLISCVLWPHVPPLEEQQVWDENEEYQRAYDEHRQRLSVGRTNIWAKHDQQHLERALESVKSERRRCIVLSHFPPVGGISDRSTHTFCSLMEQYTDEIVCWAFGNTREKHEYRCNGVKLRANSVI